MEEMLSTGWAMPGLTSFQEFTVEDRGDGQDQDSDHDHSPGQERERPLENIALRTPVDKGERGQEQQEPARNGHPSQELAELAGKDLQPQHLKQKEEIPFRLRMVIAGVRRRLLEQLDRFDEGQ